MGGSERVGFVSAATLFDEEQYFRLIEERLIGSAPAISRELVHIRWDSDWRKVLERVDAILIGGGNTYALLKRLHQSGLLEVLRKRIRERPSVYWLKCRVECGGSKHPDQQRLECGRAEPFRVTGISAVQYKPHYIERAASDAPHSETRDFRIQEFHQVWENPVVAIEESAILKVIDTKISIVGAGRAKVFIKGDEPRWFEAGEDLTKCFMESVY